MQSKYFNKNEQCLYFFRNIDTNNIKIGISYDPLFRLKTLNANTDCTLTREVIIPGGWFLEKSLHIKFSKFCIKREEWFESHFELEQLIKDLKTIMTTTYKYNKSKGELKWKNI